MRIESFLTPARTCRHTALFSAYTTHTTHCTHLHTSFTTIRQICCADQVPHCSTTPRAASIICHSPAHCCHCCTLFAHIFCTYCYLCTLHLSLHLSPLLVFYACSLHLHALHAAPLHCASARTAPTFLSPTERALLHLLHSAHTLSLHTLTSFLHAPMGRTHHTCTPLPLGGIPHHTSFPHLSSFALLSSGSYHLNHNICKAVLHSALSARNTLRTGSASRRAASFTGEFCHLHLTLFHRALCLHAATLFSLHHSFPHLLFSVFLWICSADSPPATPARLFALPSTSSLHCAAACTRSSPASLQE